jgi:hypothetical protein
MTARCGSSIIIPRSMPAAVFNHDQSAFALATQPGRHTFVGPAHQLAPKSNVRPASAIPAPPICDKRR